MYRLRLAFTRALGLVVLGFGCVVLGLGCIDRPEPPAARSSAIVNEGARGLKEGPGFFFLSPIAPDGPRAAHGAFEPNLDPTVRVDRVDPSTGATVSTAATFTTRTEDKIRRQPRREFYIVRWQTGRGALDTTASYAIRVAVGGREVGRADVRVVDTDAAFAAVDRSRFVAVRKGAVLAIKFRIERKAVDADEDGVLDWQDNCPTVPNAPGPRPRDALALGPTPSGCDYHDSDCDPQEVDCAAPTPGRQLDTDGDGVGDACECLGVSCVALDRCHAIGTCDKTTGSCSAPVLPDQDLDGVCDVVDGCPADAAKAAPGLCGCGIADRDSDGDLTADCQDGCPLDPLKTAPGLCACGTADTDADGDLVPDCHDACPGDALKAGAGSCGCGVPDVDGDGDGTFDCDDQCPADAAKIRAGGCGCGVADLDTDGDGTLDCHDLCPTDAGKINAGVCGCGVSDADDDGDLVANCIDLCPLDPAKQAPGLCACGVSDRDSDFDGTPDCHDLCPTDGAKIDLGVCGCGRVDSDSDGDGTADCLDFCPDDPLKVDLGVCQCGTADTDGDGDGVADCIDDCPTDPNKLKVGVCGCEKSDVDTDRDGVADCHDPCATDPLKVEPGVCDCGQADIDTDVDGTADCHDLCPHDPAKVDPGLCGCGLSDIDTDGDGTPDCHDLCPADPAKTAPLICGCGVFDVDSDRDGVPDCHDVCPTDPTRADVGPCGAGPAQVDITWMTVSNIYYEIGPLKVLTDGYLTRIPQSNFYGGGGGLAYTYNPVAPDAALVAKVLDALGGPSNLNLLLSGHSHFDHSFDTGVWSALTGAPIIGPRTTCYQVIAQGIPAERCREVVGGEKIVLADGVTMRVVRWNHSGDSVGNPEQHNPIELASIPVLDPVTGGLRAGVAEDFPNGGGGRGYLFTVDGVDGPFSWFFQNSSSKVDLDQPIVVDGVDYGAPIENLKAALADAELTSVDLWLGAGGADIARLVLPVLKPKAYLPVHWDNFYKAFLSPAATYRDSSLATLLSQSGVQLLKPVEVMDKWRLSRAGIQPVANTAVKQALGFTR